MLIALLKGDSDLACGLSFACVCVAVLNLWIHKRFLGYHQLLLEMTLLSHNPFLNSSPGLNLNDVV